MAEQHYSSQKAQLDKAEREHLEAIVTELREKVEADIRYQLEHTYELNEKHGDDLFETESDIRGELVRAVEREADEKSWGEKFDQYVMGVGYTFINRLTALRCMEVREFISRPVTQFSESGSTPAAEKLETDEFLTPEDALIEAYDRECGRLSDEIEILFDLDSPYSIIDPDVDTFKVICRKLDEVPREVWRADDVLGWVYEYYNASKLDELRRKADRDGLEPDDVPPANQFYTPHWVVRMLTDNSLAKMYLESKGELVSTIEDQSQFSSDERKYRDASLSSTPSLANFSTYLVPTKEEGEAPDLDDPENIRVIDPACGSGHFLLYAYDVLERIWYRERPDLDRAKVPTKILHHNLFGVDLDLRACQLAAFNLYLKARDRTEEEGATEFKMPEVGIVCADTKIANVEPASDVFDEVARDHPEIRETLEDLLEAFEGIQGLGSLLDVRGTLEEQFTMREQPTLLEAIDGPGSLVTFLDDLHNEIAAHRNGDSFMAQDLRSFLRLLVILSQDYDVALMNPPYGARNRMPGTVKDYVENHYEYTPEFYINFFEVCDRLAKENGRVGMLVPRSFMFKRGFEDFRKDFFEQKGTFDFLAEYGLGILDNATVRTVGTVVRKNGSQNDTGQFIRLHDAETEQKETAFLDTLSQSCTDIQRLYNVDQSEFKKVPGYPISYWTPPELRDLHEAEKKIDANAAGVEGKSIAKAANGITTGNNSRFVYNHWEVDDFSHYIPYAKGGSDAWVMPELKLVLNWHGNGREIIRSPDSYPRNIELFGEEALTWTYSKETGRRFGYLPSGGGFDSKGSVIFSDDVDLWLLMPVLNSTLYHGLFLSLTPERDWQVGDVGRIPWIDSMEYLDALVKISKRQHQILLQDEIHDPTSPYYIGPAIIPEIDGFFWTDHPYVDKISQEKIELESYNGKSFEERTYDILQKVRRRQQELFDLADDADNLIFDQMDVDEEIQEKIINEIKLRTSNNLKPTDFDNPDLGGISQEHRIVFVKELLHHLTFTCVLNSQDGIVPVTENVNESSHVFDLVKQRFEELFNERAPDRLEEADDLLGDRTPDEHPFPNVKHWLEKEFFKYHVEKFDNCPIVWELTTERLVSEPIITAFSCFVSYYHIDASIFDRIEANYLESLKTEYRSRRNAADQRRSDGASSTSEKAEAVAEFERYEEALTQIEEFQEVALQLSSSHHPQYNESVQSVASDLKPMVRQFRKRTEERLHTLDELEEQMDSDQIEDYFSPTFLDRVNEHRDEWINALKELEKACDAYMRVGTAPIEAHLYDLFIYIDDNVGSTHHGSNDITFLNHYFSKGANFLDNGEPREGLELIPRLKAELAAATDNDVELAVDIKDKCNHLIKMVDSDWEVRALHEVIASGFDPVKKHGIKINIKPLSDKRLVPEFVEVKVL